MSLALSPVSGGFTRMDRVAGLGGGVPAKNTPNSPWYNQADDNLSTEKGKQETSGN